MPMSDPRPPTTADHSPDAGKMIQQSTTGWQPIEAVPEDIMHSADPVLLWSPDTHTCVVYGRYWTQDQEWQEDHMATPLRPTHWMPLPEPPDAD